MGNQLESGQNKNRLLNDEEISILQNHFANRDQKCDQRYGFFIICYCPKYIWGPS